jgi:hypothetical protein
MRRLQDIDHELDEARRKRDHALNEDRERPRPQRERGRVGRPERAPREPEPRSREARRDDRAPTRRGRCRIFATGWRTVPRRRDRRRDAEALAEIRARIVEQVRAADDLDGLHAAMLSVFENFTLRDGKLVRRPRLEALAGFREHPLGPLSEDPVEVEPVYRRIPVSMRKNIYSDGSPSSYSSGSSRAIKPTPRQKILFERG